MSYSVISADNHIIEHRDAFVTRMPAKLRDRAPRVMRAADGGAMYSTDYPHSVSLWPNSRKFIPELTQGYDAVAKHKVLAGNAARVFGFE